MHKTHKKGVIMKGISKIFVTVFISMSLAFFVTACSDDSSDSTKQNTAVTTTDQGAQASTGAVNTANSINSMGVNLSGTVGEANGNTQNMPKVKLPGSDSMMALSANRFSKRVSPLLKKAKALHGIKKAPITENCNIGGTYQHGWNEDYTTYTLTYSDCKESYGSSYLWMDGTWTLSVNADWTSLSMNMNLTDTMYPDSSFTPGTAEYKIVYNNYSFSYSGTDDAATATSFAYSGNYTMGGSWTGEDYVNDKKYQGINGLTMDASFIYTEVVPNSQYNYTSEYTMNGSFSYKAFDTSSGADTLEWQEAYSFSNLTTLVTWDETWDSVTYEWDAVYSYSINGTFGLDLYPDNACFEGQFKFETVDPIELTYTATYDSTTDEYTYNYSYTGGHIIINDVVDVVYNPDGSVTVTVNGEETTYQDNQLDGMCSELSSGEDDGTQQGGTGPSSQ